jgi:hypothetical protein
VVSNQNQLVANSQAWNACMPMVEAGIEEALTHCTLNYKTNMAANGWVQIGTDYVKTNVIGDGSVKALAAVTNIYGYYVVRISPATPYRITSTGYYPLAGTSRHLSRTVRVDTTTGSSFFGALVVRDSIDMNGNNVLTDSYDSTNPAKSTAGRYDPTRYQGDKGDVAALNGLDDSLLIGNANVWGHVFTGPTAKINVGPKGAVGSATYQRSGASGIEDGWWLNDLNYSLPDVVLPFSGGSTPAGITISGVAYGYNLTNGNYELPTLDQSVVVTGNASLYVSGNINVSGITIMPGASLKIYCAGASADLGSVINPNVNPLTMSYFGLNSNTSVSMKGNTKITAAIYAPYARFMMVGNGEIYGSVVAGNAKLGGTVAIHYDESLLRQPPSRGVIATSWNEI